MKDVIGIDKIIGMPVLSRSTGNNLGKVSDLYIDPAHGVLKGVTIVAPNGKFGGIDYHDVYSFGQDAVMVDNDNEIVVLNEEWVEQHPHAKRHLIGTNIVTDAGNHLGQISNLYVRLTSPPAIVYEVRGSMMDSLLGRNLFIYAANAGALSSNAERIIVPNAVMNNAAANLTELFSRPAAGGRTADPTTPGDRGKMAGGTR
jgi:uncharacterized protein YrrD